MKHLVVVAALLLSTAGSFAGEPIVKTNLCSGLIGHVPGTHNQYTIGNDGEVDGAGVEVDTSPTCSFSSNSPEGRKIFKKCPVESVCEVRSEGLFYPSYNDFLIKKVFSVKKGHSDYYGR
jgi:hypothetical protein